MLKNNKIALPGYLNKYASYLEIDIFEVDPEFDEADLYDEVNDLNVWMNREPSNQPQPSSQLKVVELKAQLKLKNLKTDGNKAVLIARLDSAISNEFQPSVVE